jgi:putative holliday junction resolvase
MEKSIDQLNNPQTSHILGIDFGSAKVGLSLADTETRIAFVYGAIAVGRDFFDKIGEIIQKESVEAVVIGIPQYNIEKEGEEKARKMGEALQGKFDVAVEYQDEMFTTKMAQANLREKGEKMVSKIDDAESARIILQEWLDKKKI